MTCEPRDLFTFADWLLSARVEPPEPVLLRTIVNRAYYAALLAARDHTGSVTTNPSGHKHVVDALRGVSIHAANLLNAMRIKRNETDYELSKPITVREALLSMQNSRQILYELGETFPAGHSYTKDYLDHTKFVSITGS